MNLPFSPSADRNKEAIGNALQSWFGSASTVFEFGSGTGQHAVYLCQRYPHLRWQPSELLVNLEMLELQIHQAGVSNVAPPVECDVLQLSAPDVSEPTEEGTGQSERYSLVFSANTAHIMSTAAVEQMMVLSASLLESKGVFALYGPFRYGSQHTAEGNIQFDAMLRSQDAEMGLRDKHELDRMAIANGMMPVDDLAMPSNNRMLIWKRCGE